MMDKANLTHRCSNVMISVNALATFLYFMDSYVRGHTLSKDSFRYRYNFHSLFTKHLSMRSSAWDCFFHVLYRNDDRNSDAECFDFNIGKLREKNDCEFLAK